MPRAAGGRDRLQSGRGEMGGCCGWGEPRQGGAWRQLLGSGSCPSAWHKYTGVTKDYVMYPHVTGILLSGALCTKHV